MGIKENQDFMYSNPKGFISVGEAERKFFISRPYIYYLVKNGKINTINSEAGLLVKQLQVKKIADLIKVKKENTAARKRDLQRTSLRKSVQLSYETKDDEYNDEFIDFFCEYIKKDKGKEFFRGLLSSFNKYWKEYMLLQHIGLSEAESYISEQTK
jgi:hypothetical protein